MSDNPISKEPAKPNGNESKAPTDNELGRKLRTPMLFALIFFVYAILSVLSTTDMMLLREGGIALPIIQSSVPVVEFYRITPLLLVVLHLHLLARLVIYARRIYDSKSSKKTLFKTHGWLSKYLIILFSFEQKSLVLDAKHGNLSRIFMFVAFTIIFVIIPLLVLLILQARFLAYQDEGITLYHQFLITLYLFLQLIFMRSFYNIFMSKMKPPLVPVLIVGIINVKRVKRVIRVVLGCLMFLVLPLLFVWTVALVPGSAIEKTIISIEETIKFDLRRSIARCFFKDWWKSHEPDLFQCDFLEFKRFINIQNETITLREPPPEIVAAIIQTGGDPSPIIPCEHVGKLKLNERHLLYANFSDSIFKCVEMKGAQLSGSILARANLSTANLVDANLSGADLRWADLREADLRWADLRWAGLREADLREADLRWADLRWAGLREADLREADLRWADLREADLRGAYLSSADLSSADLNSADLSSADLSSADLRWADLRSADLNSADLSSADLSYADLSYADLSSADLGGAYLDGTDLSWVDLRGADLGGIDLSGAELHGAKLSRADLRWADLSGADLRVFDLSGADMAGANLSGANLSGADLSGADLSHADLSRAKLYGARLYKADLHDIILNEATLYGANFSGSTPHRIELGQVYVKRPAIWFDVLDDIKHDLREAGYQEREIDARLAKIELSAASTLGYVLPTGTDHCLLYVDEPDLGLSPQCDKIRKLE